MITTLATPSVCVIDEDEKDFRPILDALNGLYMSCVHIRGNDTDQLPAQPFKGLRLVFTDLYLSSGAVGKDMASHTANVFRHIVSSDTAPVVVVIWSKHANEKNIDPDVPVDDQETEADLFKRTLLEAQPEYKRRLIFTEMAKPSLADRPEQSDVWIAELKTNIEKTLEGREGVHMLWAWESLVREASISVSEGLTSLAHPPAEDPGETLEDGLKKTMQLLAKAQGGGDLSVATAPWHLTTVLAQLLADQLEHASGISSLTQHGEWLNAPSADANELAPQMNSFLLTAGMNNQSKPLMPGMIYYVDKSKEFQQLFGVEGADLVSELFKDSKKNTGVTKNEWSTIAQPVLLEISQACDFDQGNRPNAILIAGLILPSNARPNAKSEGAFLVLPDFSLRWPMDDFAKQDVFLVFCSRYRATLSETNVPEWLKPWFRLRELPTASLRNWYAAQSSRVGYVSL